MPEPGLRRAVRGIASRAYAPQPVRPGALRWAVLALTCTACLAIGAFAAAWHLRGPQESARTAPRMDEDIAQDALLATLAQTRLALAQEAAARAALQKAADASATEARRLDAELRFLRGQRGQRATRP